MTGDLPAHGPRNSVILALLALAGFISFAALAPSQDSEIGATTGLLIAGVKLTVVISIVTFAGGALFAALLVAGDIATHAVPRRLARFHIAFFRGTPLIAQLYLVYYGAGEIHGLLERLHLWWIFKGPMACVILVFILNSAAYQAHVVSGALRALPKEQRDAALALGLSSRATMLKVLLPQAMLTALRPLANEATKMIKASSIASVVTVLDLLGTAHLLFNETLDFSFFYVAACIYLIMIGAVRIAMEALEGRLLRHMSYSPPDASGAALALSSGS